jgi:hypothetical protein
MPAIDALREIIDITAWCRDEEFGVHPYGSKAKRTLICAIPAPHPSLIADHHYLFKRAEDWKGQQMWSEAIAYQLGSACGIDVPAAFIARDTGTGETGVLIEFFYGYPGDQRPHRLLHGADMLQGAGLMDGDGHPHAVLTNVEYCRSIGITDAPSWWGRTLIFDTLIGNTDRHSQNWGFMTQIEEPVMMAPAFDNGTSLGFQIADARLAREAEPDRIARFVGNGRHSFGWSADEQDPAAHIGLCQRFAERFPEARDAMCELLRFEVETLHVALDACTRLEVAPIFTDLRARFVLSLILHRRDRLMELFGG